MGEYINDPGGHKVSDPGGLGRSSLPCDPGGGGAGYEKDPGGWKVILDPGTGV